MGGKAMKGIGKKEALARLKEGWLLYEAQTFVGRNRYIHSAGVVRNLGTFDGMESVHGLTLKALRRTTVLQRKLVNGEDVALDFIPDLSGKVEWYYTLKV
jgi:hypothetical protein